MRSHRNKRLFFTPSLDLLPNVGDRYPFMYFEDGKFVIKDGRFKVLSHSGEIVDIPIATVSTLLMGPRTSITHEAVKTLSNFNCGVCWVDDNQFNFHSFGRNPTSNSTNFRKQAMMSCNEEMSLVVAKRLFTMRYPDIDVTNKSIKELLGIEGNRMRETYAAYSKKYNVPWIRRMISPIKFNDCDTVNKILTTINISLYGIVTTVISSLGFSPYLGFIHSGSPLPFVYDLVDVYKEKVCVDLAFYLANKLNNIYDKFSVYSELTNRLVEINFLKDLVNTTLSCLESV